MKMFVVFVLGPESPNAETIARAFSGDVEEIIARENRSDFLGGVSRQEAVLKQPAAIRAAKRDPASLRSHDRWHPNVG